MEPRVLMILALAAALAACNAQAALTNGEVRNSHSGGAELLATCTGCGGDSGDAGGSGDGNGSIGCGGPSGVG